MRHWTTSIALAALFLPNTLATQAQTVGLLHNDDRASSGYTIVAPLFYDHTYLVDIDGQLVHSWEHQDRPGSWVYLLHNGDMLRGLATFNPAINFGGLGGRIEKTAWDGTVLWTFEYSDEQHALHHDIAPLPNGNVLMVAWEHHTVEDAIANGRDPALLTDDAFWPEQIIEVRPTPPVGGEIVWEWHVWDHLIQEFDSTKANFGVVADHPELVDINGAPEASADWLHFNAIDYSPELDQIALSVPGFNEVWIIDHSTTTEEAAGHVGGNAGRGGDLLYRWGNPPIHRGQGDRELGFQHDVQWVDSRLPGGGNILIFDNGIFRPDPKFSSIVEIAPPVNPDGTYRSTAGGQPASADVVWRYEERDVFYSGFASGVQRLPNGHTLIAEAQNGRIFEVTPAGEIVWQYINPVTNDGPLTQGDVVPPGPTRNPDWLANSIFRATRYPPGFLGFAGKDLTPMGTVENTPTAIEEQGRVPSDVVLHPNSPNPFSNQTSIAFTFARATDARITVYDLLGRRVATLAHRVFGPGRHSLSVDATRWPSGIYMCQLETPSAVETQTMLLVR